MVASGEESHGTKLKHHLKHKKIEEICLYFESTDDPSTWSYDIWHQPKQYIIYHANPNKTHIFFPFFGAFKSIKHSPYMSFCINFESFPIFGPKNDPNTSWKGGSSEGFPETTQFSMALWLDSHLLCNDLESSKFKQPLKNGCLECQVFLYSKHLTEKGSLECFLSFSTLIPDSYLFFRPRQTHIFQTKQETPTQTKHKISGELPQKFP